MNTKTKMVVLDDDPTGIQTVHGCLLLTDWSEPSLHRAFTHEQPFFYILTNTRAMSRSEATMVVRSVMEAVLDVAAHYDYQLMFVSRSDSCLRGHFPLETDVMREVLTRRGIPIWPTVPFVPAFIEAGRVTIDGTHYMRSGQDLIPVSETEFAHDNVFGYHTSVLKDYIQEKGAKPEEYDIVDAASYEELYAYCKHLDQETKTFKGAIVIRSSSSFPKAMSGIADQPLLDRSILMGKKGPGCFIVGSHVQKTTRQLNHLLESTGTKGIEVDVERILRAPKGMLEDVIQDMSYCHQQGLTPVVYTSRKEIRIDDAEKRLHLGQEVSDFLVSIVTHLPFEPSYLAAKGGITSNDILTKGLHVGYATVEGQIINNVPCVQTERFAYIIFPGNVGDDQSLAELYEKLRQ